MENLSKREQFALAIQKTLIALHFPDGLQLDHEVIAKDAINHADALIEVLKASEPETDTEAVRRFTDQTWPGDLEADGRDVIVTVGGDAQRRAYRLIGDLDGSITVDGDGDGSAYRSGDGDGNAYRSGDGDGNACRSGEGDGNAERHGSGNGFASRHGAGNGDACRDGEGDGNAYHYGYGNGHAYRNGERNGRACHGDNGDVIA